MIVVKLLRPNYLTEASPKATLNRRDSLFRGSVAKSPSRITATYVHTIWNLILRPNKPVFARSAIAVEQDLRLLRGTCSSSQGDVKRSVGGPMQR
jgi:hypothetical protein